MRNLGTMLLLGVGLAAAGAAAEAQTRSGGDACTEFRFTDPSTGRGGTVCLPVPASATIASPNVYCEGGNCVITGGRATFKPGAIGGLSLGNTGGTDDDTCIIYKYHDPAKGTSGEVCLPFDITGLAMLCDNGHCVIVEGDS